MGSLLNSKKTSVLVGFLLLLLPALVYCDRFVSLDLFQTSNCTFESNPTVRPMGELTFSDYSGAPNNTFSMWPFQSAMLTNVTGEVLSLLACQFGVECDASGAILISFNMSDIGACSTAGPPGTQFENFLIT